LAFRLPDVADKAETFAGNGADQPLLFGAISDCVPNSCDPAGQCGFRDDAAFPYGGDQVVLADDAIAVADQKLQ